MTPTTLAETILRDVRRYTIRPYVDDLPCLLENDLLAALTAALDGADERAGEVLEGVMPYDGDPCGCAYCGDNPATLWRNGEALCGECQDRQEAALVPDLLAQNAALRAERDALVKDKRWIMEERDRTFALMLARAEAAEAKVAEYETEDGMEGAIVHAIRLLLNSHNVPAAAFIDDHVGNAIAQRDAAEAEVEKLRGALSKLPAVYAHQINTGVREVYDPLQRFYTMESVLAALTTEEGHE